MTEPGIHQGLDPGQAYVPFKKIRVDKSDFQKDQGEEQGQENVIKTPRHDHQRRKEQSRNQSRNNGKGKGCQRPPSIGNGKESGGIPPDPDEKIGSEVHPARPHGHQGQGNGNGRVQIGGNQRIEKDGAHEIGNQGKEDEKSRPDQGVSPVPRFQDPVPLLPLVADDDAVSFDFDVYHSASLLAIPCGLTIRMIMTRSKAEKFMNRGSPNTKETKAWVNPIR